MAVEREFTGHLAGSNPHVRIEYRIRHKDGQYRWMLCRGLVATEPGFYRFPASWPPRSHAFAEMKPGRKTYGRGALAPALAELSPAQSLL